MIIAEKTLTKNRFMIKKKKTFQKVGIEGSFLNLIKVYNKLPANIILSEEKLSLTSKIRNKIRVTTLTTIM